MIPPAPADLLSSNPQFAKLHTALTTKILDADASTRATNSTYTATAAQLHSQRVALARDRILLSTLSALTDDEHLPEPLRDLIALITAYIRQADALSHDDQTLLAPSLSAFRRQLPLISRALAAQLRDQERALATAAAVAALHSTATATTSSSSATAGSADLNALGPLLTAQTAHLAHLRTHAVPRALTACTDALTALLRARTAQIRRAVLGLERRKHGAGARYVLGRAAFLAAVAEALRGKVRVEALEVWRDGTGHGGAEGGVGERVERRVAALGVERRVLEGRRSELEDALGEYEDVGALHQGQGGGDLMRRLGRRYREVEDELAEVKSDVERLKRQMEEGRVRRRGS